MVFMIKVIKNSKKIKWKMVNQVDMLLQLWLARIFIN